MLFVAIIQYSSQAEVNSSSGKDSRSGKADFYSHRIGARQYAQEYGEGCYFGGMGGPDCGVADE